MAGIWTGARGLDVNPKADGPETEGVHRELRTAAHRCAGQRAAAVLRACATTRRSSKPDDPKTFHDQVGYWLWEPATGDLIQTLAIPRGQVAMFTGRAAADAKRFAWRPCAGR